MKDINEMSYQELLDLEESIRIAKDKFYAVEDLEIAEGHLCTTVVVGNYNFLGRRTPVRYDDIFSGEFVATYHINAQLPTFKEVLDENNIPYIDYMCLTEIEKAWTQYKKITKPYEKVKH